MERTVPTRASEEIDLYIRTIYSLLRSTTRVRIRTLEEVHAGMSSSLHPQARQGTPDISSFIYATLRLPECITEVKAVLLGQSATVFEQSGFDDVEKWEEVTAKARRRRCFYDGESLLACYIASRSDIDDVIPLLTAFQIEWNKLHNHLQELTESELKDLSLEDQNDLKSLAKIMGITKEELRRLETIWGGQFKSKLRRIKEGELDLEVQLFSGSLNEYRRATRFWWENIEDAFPDITRRPVYFISSNTHSIVNLMTGFALTHRDRLMTYLKSTGDEDLLAEWRDISQEEVPSRPENFLYYILKKYQSTPEGKDLINAQSDYEEKFGVHRIPSEHAFDVEAQIIELSNLNSKTMDPRLTPETFGGHKMDWSFLSRSNALILNIDYPLGLAAYNLLVKIAEHTCPMLGIYIMGKAATLNGRRGDVIIPNVTYSEQSHNTYLYNNCFNAGDVSPYLVYGTVLDNQKSVSVMGTYLQNAKIMEVIYREGYTDIEMEAGPYLSAVYELTRPKRHPVDEIVNLYNLPFDLGILHYASDTPLTKGENLGAGTLSYFGVDSTYATSLAILRRIMQLEYNRITNG
ncbi:MAG: hypothetical protein SVT56_12500 [Chloroflexota bacterium]|jgi:hypothetical protein|nr:hypothetical protein [Chloroflexota bacterium]